MSARPIGWLVFGIALFIGPGSNYLLSQQRTDLAHMSGVVLTTDEPRQPVRRAIVSMLGSDRDTGHHAITDDTGHFEIGALPAGRYKLSAKKAGFVTIAYGAFRPEFPGTDLALAKGQHLSALTVSLARGAVITGTVRDETGAPAVDLEVQIERSTAAGELYQRFTTTDSRGEYRLFGLPAGRYLVSVKPRSTSATLNYPGSDAQVDAILQRAGRFDTPQPSVTRPLETRQPVSDFARIYYPRAFASDDATPVVLSTGEERAGVDMAVALMPLARLTGRIVAPDGTAVTSGTVILVRVSRTAQRSGSAGVRTDGTFEFSSVAAGKYQVATWRSTTVDGAAKCQFAATNVDVTGDLTSGLTLVLKPCLRIAGRIEMAADATADTSRARLAGTLVRVELDRSVRQPTETELPLLAPIDADGTFAFGGTLLQQLLPGSFVLSTSAPRGSESADWWLQAARTADGQDILDRPLTLTDNSPEATNVVLTFTDRHTSLSGSLVTATGRPAVDYTVIAFTTNKDWWRTPFRRVLTTRPASDGAYLLNDLPPGEYYLGALADVAPNEWRDREFLEQAVKKAVVVTIGPGEKKIQSLQIGRQ